MTKIHPKYTKTTFAQQKLKKETEIKQIIKQKQSTQQHPV